MHKLVCTLGKDGEDPVVSNFQPVGRRSRLVSELKKRLPFPGEFFYSLSKNSFAVHEVGDSSITYQLVSMDAVTK